MTYKALKMLKDYDFLPESTAKVSRNSRVAVAPNSKNDGFSLQNSHFENWEMTVQEAWLSRRYDSLRTPIIMAFGEGAAATAEALYLDYIRDWQPSEYNRRPATPPNTRNNEKLWVLYWQKLAGIAVDL
ncbi:MAG: hypothetical protein GX130_05300 [Candidatus Hydrogenedens sp.]|jgi:hypothetical protein|nr:hypothetical protein [Candidatus Hydrogenedens sp.]